METRRLGQSDLAVTLICLGTMTWGQQNTEAEAHEQLDYAWSQGINFLDAAEMYPVPGRAETQGRTESVIGTWMAARKNRDQVIVATKVVGPSPHMPWIRGADNRLDRKNITVALEGSLQRLRTDYIDLYQLHWPDRKTNTFGQLGFEHHPEEVITPIAETLTVLGELVDSGKVRHIGLSNETPWGAMQFLHLAEKLNLPRVVSIQNPYNLVNRAYEVGLAEVSIREQCGLLAYSPLAGGALSGKYLNGQQPAGARRTLFPVFDRYDAPETQAAIGAYVDLARRHGLDPCQMALAWVNSRDFVTSNIIGATTMAQLKSNIASHALALPPEVVSGIEAIHRQWPNPAP
ncbi:MAG: NADP(H)-dependent aldo-keto reductase [Candidatus Melainabacteria bacterium]